MKTFGILVALVVLVAPCLLADSEIHSGSPAISVTLELVDGSRLIGRPMFDALALRTGYAQFDIPLDQISRMQGRGDRETVSLVLTRGDRVSGVPVVKALTLQTGFGTVRVGIEQIRAMTVTVRGGFSPNDNPDNLAVNRGFEEGRSETRWPVRTGVWSGNLSSVVAAEQEIHPRSGERMLRFDMTSWGRPGDCATSQVSQIIDLSKFREALKAGKVRVAASAWFNRVRGNATTDRKMQISLFCYRGEPAQNFDNYEHGRHVTVACRRIDTDDDVSTWECASTEVKVPAEADYVLVDLVAIEDVRNDLDGKEFDGHYADDVDVRVLIDP